jgi:hypothetical protein
MSPFPPARRWVVILLLLVLEVVALSSWSQTLRPAEIRAHAGPAIEEVLRRNVPDRTTQELVRQELRRALAIPNGSIWQPEQASNRLAEAFKKRDLSLGQDSQGFVVLRRPTKEGVVTLRTSTQLVDWTASEIRRRSIFEEIGPVASKNLDRGQLLNYLRYQAKVPDYKQVAESFDATASPPTVVTFQEPVTLLRLYGGETKATGRYYFCCIWRLDSTLGRVSGPMWSDASGLATPPQNLRNHLRATTVPAGAQAIVGTVADNFSDQFGHPKPGGNIQIFVPHVGTFPYHKYKFANENSPSEIVLQSEDRILRFRSE